MSSISKLLGRSGVALILVSTAVGTAIAQDGPPPEAPAPTEWSPLQSNRFGSELGQKMDSRAQWRQRRAAPRLARHR